VAILRNFARLWSVARRIEDLFLLEEQVKDIVAEINDRLRHLEGRIVQIEADAPRLMTEARSAASAAATLISGAALNDVVTRLTRVEVRLEEFGARDGSRVVTRHVTGPVRKRDDEA
jgi:phage shock protein A